jgi:hypothetical protein
MARQIELDRRYLCREETTEDRVPGSFEITDRDMKLSLLSFDKFFFIDDFPLITVRLENNTYVTMFQNVYGGPGRSWTNGTPPREAHTQTVSANIVVVGPEAWRVERAIRHVGFNVPLANGLLKHDDTYDALARAEVWGLPNSKLLEISFGNVNVLIGYEVRGVGTDPTRTRISPRIGVDFFGSRSLDTYLPTVYSIVRFFSAALCLRLRPHDTEIRAQTHEEFVAAVEAQEPAHTFEAHYIWSHDIGLVEEAADLHGSFVLSHCDAERDNLTACLKAWLERDEDWRNATTLMMGSLKLKDEVSAERMLMAFKWLEEIPTAVQLRPISTDHVDTIAQRAAEVATELGYEDWTGRIRGSLRVLRFESHRDRFARLVSTLRKRFGAEIVDDEIVDHLVQATAFRGRIAHGHFEPQDEEEFSTFMKASAALECLNYLLMLRDLPISEAAVERLRSNRIMTQYYYS